MGIGIGIEEDGEGVWIRLRVQPRASKNEISGVYQESLKVKLTSPPLDGRANEQCVRFLAAELGVSRGSLTILSGLRGRSKRLRIAGMDRIELIEILRSKGYV